MCRNVPVFLSQRVRNREILWVWKRKVIRQSTFSGLFSGDGREQYSEQDAKKGKDALRHSVLLCCEVMRMRGASVALQGEGLHIKTTTLGW